MAVAFVILTALLVYIYCGYPCLLSVLARLFRRSHRTDESLEPSITLIISVHNEERVIEEKLANALDLDYPPDKLEIVVVSDGSTDRTDEIVTAHAARGATLIRTPERRGKTAGLNLAMTRVNGDIVVFSDANAIYDRHALRRLVRHFADEAVGYVVGHARYSGGDESAAGNSESTYWDMEVRIKQWESDFSSVVGGDGALYAIRRHLYEPLAESDINDFVNPLQIVAKGYRGIFDPSAWCSERTAGEFGKEYGRKVRIANRSFNGLLRVAVVCNPFVVGRFAWQVISHKLLRWFSPFIIACHLAASVMTAGTTPTGMAAFAATACYLLFFLFALVGWWREIVPGRHRALWYLPYYFVLMNIAAAVGVIKRLRGEVISTWSTVRESSSPGTRAAVMVPLILVPIVIACAGRLGNVLGAELPLLHGSALLLFAILVYTYVGYPLAAAGLARLYPVESVSDDNHLPSATLLIVAYNEEKDIERKIINSLELDYPADRLRIVVASDGSTDATNELVARYADRLNLLAFPVNRGKIAALNDAMAQLSSDVVALSDANVMYDRPALRKLVRHFRDPRVGVVSGKVILLNGEVSYGKAENRYYGIEHFIQQQEGRSGAVIGADGAMYAIRRELFTPPPADTILDDFVISMNIARQGYLVLHDEEAVGYEHNINEIDGEFRRKARIIAGGIQCLVSGQGVPSPNQGLLMFKFVSHKVLRWFSGILSAALLVLLFRIIWLDGTFFDDLLLYAFGGGALVALLGQVAPVTRRLLPVGLIHYLFMLKLATLVGCYLGFTGRQRVTWRSPGAAGVGG